MSSALLGTIVIPVLNEAQQIHQRLLDVISVANGRWQIVVVDGGSHDGTVGQLNGLPVQCVVAPCGRAAQMNAGAKIAEGDVLLFLHSDTQLPRQLNHFMAAFLKQESVWGRFDVRLNSRSFFLKGVAYMMNLRSRCTGIATGDQALFVRASTFEHLKGFSDIPLMEDVDFSKRAKRLSRPYCIDSPVLTSARKWESEGVIKTIVLMWSIRLAYFVGMSPSRLHRWYYPKHYE